MPHMLRGAAAAPLRARQRACSRCPAAAAPPPRCSAAPPRHAAAPPGACSSRREALGVLLAASLFCAPARGARADDSLEAPPPPPLSALDPPPLDAMAADVPSTGAFGADATAPPAAQAPAAPAAPPASAAAAPGTVRTLSAEERLLLEQNQRIKSLNRAPDDFPAFIRKGARSAQKRKTATAIRSC